MNRHLFNTLAERLRDIKKQPGDVEWTVEIRDNEGRLQGVSTVWARDLQDANNCASAAGCVCWSIRHD